MSSSSMETKCSKCNSKLQNIINPVVYPNFPIECSQCNRNRRVEEQSVSGIRCQESSKGSKSEIQYKGLTGLIKTTWQRYTSTWLKNRHEIRLQKRISDNIDQQLRKEHRSYWIAREVLERSAKMADGTFPSIPKEDMMQLQTYGETSQPTHHRLLLIGTRGSGKSTFMKQMRILYGDGFSEQEKEEIVKNVKDRIRYAIVAVIKSMPKLTPPITLEHSENKIRVEYLLNNYDSMCDVYTPEFFEHAEALWNDKGVQTAFEQIIKYQWPLSLSRNSIYCLNRIDNVKQKDYFPSAQDIFHNPDIDYNYKIHFQINRDVFDMTVTRSRPFSYSAFIFITACDAYDMLSDEHESKTGLEVSLELFQAVWSCAIWKHHCVILYLNKQDLLAEKILSGKSKLEDYFPNFQNYQIPLDVQIQSNESPEVTKAKYFIRDQFLNFCKASEFSSQCCFPHFTCLVDKKNIEEVFKDCRDIIQLGTLGRYEML